MIERSGPWDEEMLKGFTAPRSPLGVAALVPPPLWHFAGDVLAVEFWNDPDLSAQIHPMGVELDKKRPGGTPSHFSQTTNLPRRTMGISTPPDIKVAAFAFFLMRCGRGRKQHGARIAMPITMMR
jgi:hypothetical protein